MPEKPKSLDEALFDAWCEMEAVKRDKTNPAFRSRYADINAVLDVVTPPLQRHGVRMSQAMIDGPDASRLYLTTKFTKGGEVEEFTSSAPLAKSDPQGVGSAVTYVRRYALISYFGLSTEDDDANAASTPPALPAARPGGVPVGATPRPPITGPKVGR